MSGNSKIKTCFILASQMQPMLIGGKDSVSQT